MRVREAPCQSHMDNGTTGDGALSNAPPSPGEETKWITAERLSAMQVGSVPWAGKASCQTRGGG